MSGYRFRQSPAPNGHLRTNGVSLPAPDGILDAVLDTDTYNEIDDQFALTHALLSPERIDLQAVYAAPFHNYRSESPADGMRRSYDEIERVFDRLQIDPAGRIYRGADRYLPDATTPVECDAVADLIARAKAPRSGPLYVLAIAAPTNVAAALIAAPEIAERIVVVWLGGQPLDWQTAREFNLEQDLSATRVLLDSGVPLVLVPCKNVAEQLFTTVPEMAAYVRGRGAIGDFLYETFAGYGRRHKGWSKTIWDMAPVAWLLKDEWVPTVHVSSPILSDQLAWHHDPSRHQIRCAMDVDRDPIFADFFDKLDRHSGYIDIPY